jgi:hypothetical protein
LGVVDFQSVKSLQSISPVLGQVHSICFLLELDLLHRTVLSALGRFEATMGYTEEAKNDGQISEPLLRSSPEEVLRPRMPPYRLAWVLSCTTLFALGAAILAFSLGFQKGRYFAQLPEVLTPIPKCEYVSKLGKDAFLLSSLL